MQAVRRKVLGVFHPATWITSLSKRFTDEIIPEVEVIHICDDSMSRDFFAARGPLPDTYYRFAVYARMLEQAGAHVILLGCSTMSRTVRYVQPMVRVPILQIDRPMMETAVELGSRIGVVCTVASTVKSSEMLLRECAESKGKGIEIRTSLLEEAFADWRAGDYEGHNRKLLAEIDRLSNDAEVVCLAQLSMSVLEEEVRDLKVPVLTSGRLGVQRAKEMLEAVNA